MKKISIIFAVLAVFMLLASCSNAAGEVDLAGNPIDLAGTWSGTMAYKGDTQKDLPMSCVVVSTAKDANGYIDYAGTYVKNSSITAPADFSETDTSGMSKTERKYLYYGASTTTSTTTVLNPDGGMTITEVETLNLPEKTAIGAVAGTEYYINTDLSKPAAFPDTADAAAYAQVGGTKTTTTTTTYTAPVKNANGNYDYSKIVTTSIVPTGSYGTTSSSTTKQTNYTDKTLKEVQGNFTGSDIDSDTGLDIKDRTVAPTLKPVEYQNDKTESITFVVTKDGLYTLTTVVEETQAAAAAAEATATNYAAAERKLATKTTTKTTTGTVAAWETAGTADKEPTMKMALSSSVFTTEVAATENFLADNLNTPTVAKFDDGEYNIRFLEGKAGRKETAKTRMYVDVSTPLDSYIAILDKAVETEKK